MNIADLAAALESCWDQPQPEYFVVHPKYLRAFAQIKGLPVGRHKRSRGARGRKRALIQSHRSLY
jgi:hypothetical protein